MRVWRGRGERRGGSGEKRMSGRPRATNRTAPTDRSDGRGRPIGRPGPSDHTAIDGTGRRIRRPRAAAADGLSANGRGRSIGRPRRFRRSRLFVGTARPSDWAMCPRPSPRPTALCGRHKRRGTHHSPTLEWTSWSLWHFLPYRLRPLECTHPFLFHWIFFNTFNCLF